MRMNDLISRRALCEYALNQKDKSVTPNDIMRFPSAQPERNCSEIPNNWIPCSERLPEKEVDVLCCRNNKTVAIMHFNPVLTTRYPKGFSVIKNDFSWRQDNVVAWMPLPDPYQEEGEHE